MYGRDNNTFTTRGRSRAHYLRMCQLTASVLREFGALRRRLYGTSVGGIDSIEQRLDFLLALTACGAPAWDLITEQKDCAQVDRTCSMFSGPFYTSENHPWPESNAQFLKPVLQLRLKEATAISGLPLGDGLLQLWVKHRDCDPEMQLRIIPATDLIEPPLPVPELAIGSRFVETFYGDEGDARKRFTTETCQIIVGVTGPYFTVPDAPLLDLLNELRGADLGVPVSKLLDRFAEAIAICQWSGSDHLFGTFPSVGYDADERPPPFISLSGIEDWGDWGYAQVFFSFDGAGNVCFTTDLGRL